jgi:uncharacterized protein
VNEKIASLIRLQQFDSEIEALRQSKVRLQQEREKRRGEIRDLQAAFEDSKKALIQAQVDKKNLEMDVDAKEQAMRKSSGELNSVKSNEAYKALLTQIEEAKKAKSELEDKLLDLMERIDGLGREQKEAERKFQQEKGEVEKQVAQSEAEEKKLEDSIAAKSAERRAYHETLPADVRQAYDRVGQGPKAGPVVVAIKGQTCGGCRMHLPPSVLNDVMKGQELISCESCTRILYMPSSPVGAAPGAAEK